MTKLKCFQNSAIITIFDNNYPSRLSNELYQNFFQNLEQTDWSRFTKLSDWNKDNSCIVHEKSFINIRVLIKDLKTIRISVKILMHIFCNDLEKIY